MFPVNVQAPYSISAEKKCHSILHNKISVATKLDRVAGYPAVSDWTDTMKQSTSGIVHHREQQDALLTAAAAALIIQGQCFTLADTRIHEAVP